MINAGADTEVKNEKEETPIILFLQNLETLNSLGAIATAQALIAGGINLRTTDEDDNSVLAVAGKRSASLILFGKSLCVSMIQSAPDALLPCCPFLIIFCPCHFFLALNTPHREIS